MANPNQTKNKVTQAMKSEVGLVERQNDCIFVEEDTFYGHWKVLRTTEGSSTASAMFSFRTKYQATVAGQKIAEAIGGTFFGDKDPRK